MYPFVGVYTDDYIYRVEVLLADGAADMETVRKGSYVDELYDTSVTAAFPLPSFERLLQPTEVAYALKLPSLCGDDQRSTRLTSVRQLIEIDPYADIVSRCPVPFTFIRTASNPALVHAETLCNRINTCVVHTAMVHGRRRLAKTITRAVIIEVGYVVRPNEVRLCRNDQKTQAEGGRLIGRRRAEGMTTSQLWVARRSFGGNKGSFFSDGKNHRDSCGFYGRGSIDVQMEESAQERVL